MSVTSKAITEIKELHKFFTEWFRGERQKTVAEFPFNERFDDKLVIYFPSGYVNTRQELYDMVFNNHGGRKHLGEKFTIVVDDFIVRWESETHCLITYEEQVHIDGTIENIRLSTALFQGLCALHMQVFLNYLLLQLVDNNAPFGAKWIHIHESWKQGFAPKPK